MNLRPSLLAALAVFSCGATPPIHSQQMPAASAFTQRLDALESDPGRRVTPDGRYALVAAPGKPAEHCKSESCNQVPSLWLEDETTHQRRWLAARNSDLSAGWSPDGKTLYVQDRQASNVGTLSLYTNAGDLLLRVDDEVLESDPVARELFYDSHHYFQAVSWIDNTHLLVRFVGHTDYYPARCFELKYSVSRYRVPLHYEVKKLAARTGPVDGAWNPRTLTMAAWCCGQ